VYCSDQVLGQLEQWQKSPLRSPRYM
jgi:hypothetical protein